MVVLIRRPPCGSPRRGSPKGLSMQVGRWGLHYFPQADGEERSPPPGQGESLCGSLGETLTGEKLMQGAREGRRAERPGNAAQRGKENQRPKAGSSYRRV